MIRDLFYREIVKGLNRQLDPELFEQCAADLLRDEWPTLVPVRGGGDSGMDGAIADAKGPPFPLICTTADDVIGNLKKNLRTYLKRKRPRRRALLATSRHLTPQRLQNINKAARSLGVTLAQIYAQEAIADRLYRNPRWCKELLGLTGDPPALAAVPTGRRPYIPQPVIGRAADMKWLTETPGDLLLFGHPGSGKSFVFLTVRNHIDGLFVVDKDISKIANNVRSEKPRALMIDDAHSHLELIRQLRQLRTDVAADYRILANCWPGQRDEVASALQITTSSMRELRLLTRDEIVEVVKGAGIEGPNALIHELVDQADGRPGLAVTLTRLCLSGDAEKVVLGDALSMDIRLTFEPLVGKQAIHMLAAFAVGGEHGMPLKAVAEYLTLADTQVLDAVTMLAAGGVINEINQTTLSVRPEPLRHALVRDTFFRGALSLEIQELLELAPSRDDATLTLIGARWRGGAVPDSLLKPLVELSTSGSVWRNYTGLGPSEADWVLQSHPERLLSVARQALVHTPAKAIPLLLTAAVGDRRELHANPDQPLRLIQDWIKSAWAGKGAAVPRRKTLLDAALNWHRSNNDLAVTLKAIEVSLSPDCETSEQDPGAGDEISLRWGYLNADELNELSGIWPKVLGFLKSIQLTDWSSIRAIVEDLAYLHRPVKDLPKEFLRKKRQIAIQLLRDVVELADKRPGILQWAKHTAKTLGVKLPILVNPEYATLFPIENLRDIHGFQRQAGLKVAALAEKWAKDSPRDIAKRLVMFEAEASLSGRTWPRMTPYVCMEIAKATAQPIVWLEALIEAQAPSDLLNPFIERAKSTSDPRLDKALAACFQHPSLKGAACIAVLAMPHPPAELLQQALSSVKGIARAIEVMCMRREVPEEHILLLLRHEDGEVAGAAAVGEWRSSTPAGVRDSLCDDWKRAVVNHVKEEHDLESILRSDSSLALDWLRARIAADVPRAYRDKESISAAVKALGSEDRRKLLSEIRGDEYLAEPVVRLLVGDDLQLYECLLTQDHLKSLHLLPLKGHPDEVSWQDKGQLALNHGHPPADVASAVYGHSWGWSGKESEFWDTWAKRFSSLESHADQRLQVVGKIGQKDAEDRRNRAAQRELESAIHGRRSESF